MRDEHIKAEAKRAGAKRITRADRDVLRAVAEHNQRPHDRESEFSMQMRVARHVMRKYRNALRALADFDKGLPSRD